MPEQFRDDELVAELKRANNLAELCLKHGFAQAATIYSMTARSIDTEINARAIAKGSEG